MALSDRDCRHGGAVGIDAVIEDAKHNSDDLFLTAGCASGWSGWPSWIGTWKGWPARTYNNEDVWKLNGLLTTRAASLRAGTR